jgi:hypothetical protein
VLSEVIGRSERCYFNRLRAVLVVRTRSEFHLRIDQALEPLMTGESSDTKSEMVLAD